MATGDPPVHPARHGEDGEHDRGQEGVAGIDFRHETSLLHGRVRGIGFFYLFLYLL